MSKPNRRERELSAITHMQEYMNEFLRRWSRPRQEFPAMREALEEVNRERLILLAEVEDGAPSVRRSRAANRED